MFLAGTLPAVVISRYFVPVGGFKQYHLGAASNIELQREMGSYMRAEWLSPSNSQKNNIQDSGCRRLNSPHEQLTHSTDQVNRMHSTVKKK